MRVRFTNENIQINFLKQRNEKRPTFKERVLNLPFFRNRIKAMNELSVQDGWRAFQQESYEKARQIAIKITSRDSQAQTAYGLMSTAQTAVTTQRYQSLATEIFDLRLEDGTNNKMQVLIKQCREVETQYKLALAYSNRYRQLLLKNTTNLDSALHLEALESANKAIHSLNERIRDTNYLIAQVKLLRCDNLIHMTFAQRLDLSQEALIEVLKQVRFLANRVLHQPEGITPSLQAEAYSSLGDANELEASYLYTKRNPNDSLPKKTCQEAQAKYKEAIACHEQALGSLRLSQPGDLTSRKQASIQEKIQLAQQQLAQVTRELEEFL